MKQITLLILFYCCFACGKKPKTSIELIATAAKQEMIFQSLIKTTQNTIPVTLLDDSLSFLILPVQASCPACRKKTIDSIMKYQANLADNHYIIVSANGGRKTIRGYFQEQAYELPVIKDRLFLDSTNLAYKNKLYEDKPTMYYTFQKKTYKKVAAIPATVRDDLREFFSGHREPIK